MIASILTNDGVERPAPGAAPTAFRIWRAGANPTEKGTAIFSPRSAELLIASQEQRGVLYPIDVEHLSLNERAPLEVRSAVGWHRLEVRTDANGGPELWAADVQWRADVRAGIEERPPKWRYVSPVYVLDPDTREVIDYVNLAITNTPATWNVTSLAAARNTTPAAMLEDLPEGVRAFAATLPLPDLSILHRHCVAATRSTAMKSIDDVINDLQELASDENQDPTTRAKAKKALEALMSDGSVAVRKSASVALERIAMRGRMATAAGRKARGGVVHDGTRMVCHVMTPAEARRELAARGRR